MYNWKKKIQNFSDIQTLIILPTVDTHLRFRPSKLVSSYFSDALLISDGVYFLLPATFALTRSCTSHVPRTNSIPALLMYYFV